MKNTLFIKKATISFSIFSIFIIIASSLSSCTNNTTNLTNVNTELQVTNTSSIALIKEIFNNLKNNNFKSFANLHGTKQAYIDLVKSNTELNERDKQDKIEYAKYQFDGLEQKIKDSYNSIIYNCDSVSWKELEFKDIEYTKNNDNSASAFIIVNNKISTYKILVTNCIKTPNGWFVFTDVRWVGAN